MKYIWEAEDINSGVRFKPKGAEEVWIIGYDPSRASEVCVASLSDGCVQHHKTGADLAEVLTKGGYAPVTSAPPA
jgi:hypothetical protein